MQNFRIQSAQMRGARLLRVIQFKGLLNANVMSSSYTVAFRIVLHFYSVLFIAHAFTKFGIVLPVCSNILFQRIFFLRNIFIITAAE